MAKAKAVEEIVVEETIVETTVEETTQVVLNEPAPEKEDPGHGSRDFKKSR